MWFCSFIFSIEEMLSNNSNNNNSYNIFSCIFMYRKHKSIKLFEFHLNLWILAFYHLGHDLCLNWIHNSRLLWQMSIDVKCGSIKMSAQQTGHAHSSSKLTDSIINSINVCDVYHMIIRTQNLADRKLKISKIRNTIKRKSWKVQNRLFLSYISLFLLFSFFFYIFHFLSSMMWSFCLF